MEGQSWQDPTSFLFTEEEGVGFSSMHMAHQNRYPKDAAHCAPALAECLAASTVLGELSGPLSLGHCKAAASAHAS